MQRCSGRQVPDDRGPVIAGGDRPSAVSGHRYRRDGVLVAGEGVSAAPVARSHNVAVWSSLVVTARVPSLVTATALSRPGGR